MSEQQKDRAQEGDPAASSPGGDAGDEALFQALVQHVPGAIYRYAEGADDWVFTYMSPAIETITGYPPEHFLGKSDAYDILLHPGDRELITQHVANAIANNEDFRFEHRVVHRNGEVRWVRTRGAMAVDPATGRRAVDGVQLDVTDLYEARETLQKREATFRNLFNAMAEGYVVFTTNGQVELCNPAGLEILGFQDTDDLLQIEVETLWLEPAEYQGLIDTLLEQNSLDDQEFDLMRGDGVPITVGATLHLEISSDRVRRAHVRAAPIVARVALGAQQVARFDK